MKIRPFESDDTADVIALWSDCQLVRPWNNPKRDIERKMQVDPDLFLVGLLENQLVATVMGGYDGHRGWIYYLAVEPKLQAQGLGREMMAAMESQLLQRGCPKINLQIRRENQDVIRFYESLGFQEDQSVSLGKRLIPDD